MFAGTLLFSLGIFSLLRFPTLPPATYYLLFPPLLLLSYYIPKSRWILPFLLGFCWAMFRLDLALEEYPDAFIGNDVHVFGIVHSLPEVYANVVRFEFKVEKIVAAKGSVFDKSKVIRLSWYKTDRIPTPGEYWRFKVRLKRPYSFMNPGGFDYEGWLLRKQIILVGYIKKDKSNERLARTEGYFVERLRHKIARDMDELLEPSLRGFARALTLGDRTGLSAQELDLLSRTGTSHLIAISGLHLSVVAGFVYLIALFVLRRFYFLTQRMSAQFAAATLAFIAALFYAALAGFTLPTQRALIMIGAFFAALLLGRKFAFSHVIAVAVLAILVLDPLAIISVDFCLSFMAVVFILYLTRFRFCTEHKLIKWGKLQLFLSLALLPLLIFWFKQMPLYSAAVNLIVIPLVSFVIVPLLLIALLFLFPMPFFSAYVYQWVTNVNSIYWSVLSFFGEQGNSVVAIAMPNAFALTLAIIGIFILFMPRGLPGRYLGVLWFIPLYFPDVPRPEKYEFDFILLDVGQGLASVVQTRKHTLVYDTGARFSERFNIGDAVIAPYLKYKGVGAISTLVVSHGDNDHIGGARPLLEAFNVKRIISSVPEKFTRHAVEKCYTGQQWEWDGVVFTILHPDPDEIGSGNNLSCVLKVSGRFGSVLLTGDIEKQVEKKLLQKSPERLKSTVLIVPHHGSRTSSTREFIQQVNPDYAFFSAGYGNRFGFPKQSVISRYNDADANVRISYKTGALTARFSREGLNIHEFRTQNQRIWHDRQSE